MNEITVTLMRTGKESANPRVPRGATVADAMAKAGWNSADFANSTITDEDGDTVDLNTPVNASTTLIIGDSLAGA